MDMPAAADQEAVNQTLSSAAYFIFITQIYFCSMYAVVLWDWTISCPREYKFIWKSRWTAVKCSYLFCRYWVIFIVPYLLYCFVVDHPLEVCQKIYFIPVTLATWNQVGSESILLIRTYAFFNQSRSVLVFLLSCIIGVVSYQLYVATSQMLLLPFVKPPFTHGPCLPMSKPHSAHLLGFFIAPLAFDTLVTFMTVWKAFTIRRTSGGVRPSALIQTFLKEGVFYYILISCANLVNGIFYLQPRQAISAINIPLSVMMGPVLACRLILDLRQRGSETIEPSEATDMAFTSKPGTQPGSPFTPPAHHRNKSASGFGRYPRGMRTAQSNVLSTLGSIPGRHESDYDLQRELELERERDRLEMADIRVGLGMDVETGMDSLRGSGSNRTIIGEDGEPILEEGIDIGEGGSSPSSKYRAFDMGFVAARPPSLDEDDVVRIKNAVERASNNYSFSP